MTVSKMKPAFSITVNYSVITGNLHKFFQLLYYAVHFFFCIIPAKRKTDWHHFSRLPVIHSFYYMAYRVCAAGTGTSATHTYARHIQVKKQHIRPLSHRE